MGSHWFGLHHTPINWAKNQNGVIHANRITKLKKKTLLTCQETREWSNKSP